MTSDCQAFRDFLDENAGEQTLPARHQAHLALCDACRREWAAHRVMLAALQPGPVPELPPNFAGRVLARLPRTMPRASRMEGETVLLLLMLLASFIAIWISLPPFFKTILRDDRWLLYLAPASEWLSRIAAGIVTVFKKALPGFPGEQFFVQSWKLVFITLVTLLLTKLAWLLENRLKRPLR